MAKANKKTKPTLAEQADIHELYEESVQAVEGEIEFLGDTFKKLRGRKPLSFREDFCGTASASCEWVRTDPNRSAIGVDIDPDVLAWGLENRVGRLPEGDRSRVKLVNDDAISVTTDPVDVIAAFNFSYFLFMTRDRMRTYFTQLREALCDDGLLFLDAFGGSESFDVQEEETEFEDFTYVWDQAEFEPATHAMQCYIHFKFPDGSNIDRAFSYRWRLWTLPELLELLDEAGFSKTRIYWEGEDEDGEPSGEFYETETGEPDPAWVVYLVAEK